MKASRLSAVGVLVLVSVAGLTLAAQQRTDGSRSSLQGVWRVVERTSTTAAPYRAAGTQRNPQPGFYIFTGRHYAQVVINSDKPRPELPDVAKATADQLRAVWDPLVAQAGTYDFTGDVVTMHPVAMKTPAPSGAVATWSYKLDGTTLTMTQKTNQAGPIANPVTLKFTRAE
jgi:hypothetical protein